MASIWITSVIREVTPATVQNAVKDLHLRHDKKLRKWPAAVLPQTGMYSDTYIEWRTQQITRLVRLLSQTRHAQ